MAGSRGMALSRHLPDVVLDEEEIVHLLV